MSVGFGLATAVPPAAAEVGAVTEYGVPTAQSLVQGITGGPDGNIWFTEEAWSKIGRITPTGIITEFPLPEGSPGSPNITKGPDGGLWYTRRNTPRVGRISTSGVVKEFAVTSPQSQSWAITTGPDGNLWYTDVGITAIGKITPAGTATAYPIPAPGQSFPSAITTGPDGNLWFTEEAGSKVGRISTEGVMTRFDLPAGAATPVSIAAGADGNLWVAALSGHLVKVTTGGAMTAISLNPGSSPYGVAAGPDGNIWFTEQSLARVGRITPSGTITYFSSPTGRFGPTRITAGPDGNIWFSATTGNGVGRISLSASAPPPPSGAPGLTPNPEIPNPYGALPGAVLPAAPAPPPTTPSSPSSPSSPATTKVPAPPIGAATTTVPPRNPTTATTESAARVDTDAARPGREVTLSGEGFKPGESLTVFLGDESNPLTTITADEHGAYRVVVTLPVDATAGDHQLVVMGLGADGHWHRSVAIMAIKSSLNGAAGDASRTPLVATAIALVVAAAGATAFTSLRRARL